VSYFPQNFNPCTKCGGKAELISNSYGKKHDDVQCSSCGQHLVVDHDEKRCRLAWNKANPVKTFEVRR
jgi:DNA-directed RNA polymerase subunit RPC12/RpoP